MQWIETYSFLISDESSWWKWPKAENFRILQRWMFNDKIFFQFQWGNTKYAKLLCSADLLFRGPCNTDLWKHFIRDSLGRARLDWVGLSYDNFSSPQRAEPAALGCIITSLPVWWSWWKNDLNFLCSASRHPISDLAFIFFKWYQQSWGKKRTYHGGNCLSHPEKT